MNILPIYPRCGLGQLVPAPAPPVCISEAQHRVHMATETLAVVAVAPFMIWMATRKELPSWARLVSAVIGVGTFTIDGGLLMAWQKK